MTIQIDLKKQEKDSKLPKSLREVKEKVREDLSFFVAYYLQEHLKLNIPKFHREIYDALTTKERIVIAAPRGFAKSHLVSFFYPLWVALTERHKDILLISATGTLAEEWLGKIKNEIEMNDVLRADFGDMKSFRWRRDHLRLKSGVNIRAKGKGYQIRGFRPDLIVLDDIEDDESVRSKEQRDKLEDWFFGALMNTLAKVEGAQIAIIGTILHPLSFLTKMLVREGWWTRKYKAFTARGKSLWVELYTEKELNAKRKEIGSHKFETEYMNEPPLERSALIRNKDNLVFYKDVPPRADIRIFTAVDPAVSAKERADKAAIITAGVIQNRDRPDFGHIYILEAKADRYGENKLYEEIVDTNDNWKPEVLGIERAAWQQVLAPFFRDRANREGVRINIEEFRTAGYQGTDSDMVARDKTSRAQSVMFMIENREVHLHRDQRDLYEELIIFPEGEHDDLADAFFYVLIMCMKYNSRPHVIHTEEEYDEDKPQMEIFKDKFDLKRILKRIEEGKSDKNWFNQ